MREQFWNLTAWLTSHWGVVLFVIVFVLAFSYLISAAVLSLWQVSEGRRQAEERARLNRIIQANHAPAAPGFHRKRVS